MNKINNIGSSLISGAIGVEVIAQKGQRKIFFPDVALLRNKRIRHIDVAPIGITPNGIPIHLQLMSSTLTLVKRGTQNRVINELKLLELDYNQTKGNKICLNHFLDLPNSFLTLQNSFAGEKGALMFVFWYDEPLVANTINPKKNKEISFFELELKQSRTYFPENRTLFSKKFRALILSLTGETPTGKKGIDESALSKTYITLQNGSVQFFQNVPLYCFLFADKDRLINLENITFDFTNSFIEIINPKPEELNRSVFFNCIIEE